MRFGLMEGLALFAFFGAEVAGVPVSSVSFLAPTIAGVKLPDKGLGGKLVVRIANPGDAKPPRGG